MLTQFRINLTSNIQTGLKTGSSTILGSLIPVLCPDATPADTVVTLTFDGKQREQQGGKEGSFFIHFML